MRWPKLTKEEKAIEKAIARGEYVDVSPEEFRRMAESLKRFRKNSVLHIRINQQDLDALKEKAKKLGMKYQTFVSEVLHRAARG